MFAIGDEQWPGTSKLIEESGEVLQVLGKLMGSRGSTDHWSGDLRVSLVEEISDLEAALRFFVDHNLTDEEIDDFLERSDKKYLTYKEWHENDNQTVQ